MKSAMNHSSGGDRLGTLRRIPLFADLHDDVLERILEAATEFELPRGHVLIQPDHPGAGLFIIEEGTVAVELPGKTVELGPGEFLGDLALLTERALHTARASATTDLKCLAVRRDDFDALLQGEPHVAIAMLKTVAARLAARDQR